FDVLTFTLATGDEQYRRSAVDTIEGIAAVKEHLPGALTVLGVSNVSFGLSKQSRPILDSVFLTHCRKAGLDAAIINPRDVLPWNEIPAEARQLAEDLVLARRDDALARLIEHFEAKGPAKAVAQEERQFDTPEARLHHMIVDRQQKGLIEAIDACLKTRSAVGVINDVLLGAMKEVGDRFGAGELILPFVLQSAEVMKKSVAYLEQFMEKNDSYSRGTVVLATVFGDVHDIGKNLVKTILSNNGYTVHDLGKQVPVDRIVDAAAEKKADAIGLSALLVSTSRQMPLVVQEMDRRGLKLPILIGATAQGVAAVLGNENRPAGRSGAPRHLRLPRSDRALQAAVGREGEVARGVPEAHRRRVRRAPSRAAGGVHPQRLVAAQGHLRVLPLPREGQRRDRARCG